MKNLDLNQMESIQGGGWSLAGVICGGGFLGYGTIVTYALALGAVSAGTTAIVGLAIGGVGLAVCSQA